MPLVCMLSLTKDGLQTDMENQALPVLSPLLLPLPPPLPPFPPSPAAP